MGKPRNRSKSVTPKLGPLLSSWPRPQMPADVQLVKANVAEAGPPGWVARSLEGASSTAGTLDGRPVRIYADGAMHSRFQREFSLVCSNYSKP